MVLGLPIQRFKWISQTVDKVKRSVPKHKENIKWQTLSIINGMVYRAMK